ncbi:hypothetical protein C9J48_26185 [Photobacterium profundum]|nr:hypothetical protein C9J48_26185 [Photobacterium profundum]
MEVLQQSPNWWNKPAQILANAVLYVSLRLLRFSCERLILKTEVRLPFRPLAFYYTTIICIIKETKRMTNVRCSLILLSSLMMSSVSVAGSVLSIMTDTVLTEDHIGKIEIVVNNVTLDCAGFTVNTSTNTGSIGISLIDKKGVRVKNCNVIVSGGGEGIIVIDSHGNRIKRSSVTGGEFGFFVGNSHDIELRENTAIGSFVGFLVEGSNDNKLKENTATSNVFGFGFSRSDDNELRKNLANDNTNGFSFGDSNDNEIKRNKACNNPSGNFVEINSTGNDLEDNQFCP